MSQTIAARSQPRLRAALPGELRRFVRIEEGSRPWWVQSENWDAVRSTPNVGFIADVDGQPAGFILFQVSPPAKVSRQSLWQSIGSWFRMSKSGSVGAGHCVNLMHVSVVTDCQRRGVGHALINKVHRQFRGADDCFQMKVPESNLPMQLFLKNEGYKAVAVVRGRDGREDSYMMMRLNRLRT